MRCIRDARAATRLDASMRARLTPMMGVSETRTISADRRRPNKQMTRQSSSVMFRQSACRKTSSLLKNALSQALRRIPNNEELRTKRLTSVASCCDNRATVAPTAIRIPSSPRRAGARASKKRLTFAAATIASSMLPAKNTWSCRLASRVTAKSRTTPLIPSNRAPAGRPESKLE